MRIRGVSQIIISVALSVGTALAEDTHGLNLNHLSKAEYDNFNKTIFEEHRKDPQQVGEQAEQILIGMLALEDKQWTHKIFEIDVNYTVNTMLLLVANANKIKRGRTFIDEYKKQSEATARQLHDETQVMFLETTTDLLIRENGKLSPPRRTLSLALRSFVYVLVAGCLFIFLSRLFRLIEKKPAT
jgi:hypothetical protein